jgi:capsular exopolysaccharide synthesis family protein
MNTPTTPNTFEEEAQEPFNIKEVVYKYIVYWKWFLLSLVLALSCAFVYLKMKTPLFRIQASILLKDQQKGDGNDPMMKTFDIFSSDKIVDNEIEILKSYTLMEKVVKALNLDINYESKIRSRTIELYDQSPVILQLIGETSLTYREKIKVIVSDNQTVILNGKKYPLNEVITTPDGIFKITLSLKNPEIKEVDIVILPLNSTAENLQARINVSPSTKMSTVLDLSIEDPIPQRGEDILNCLIDAYNHAALEDKNKEAANTLAFIENRLKLLAADLANVENNVEGFKSKEGIVDINEEERIFLTNEQQNEVELSQVKIQQSVLNTIEDYVKDRNNTQGTVPATIDGLSGLNTGLNDPTLIDLIKDLTELQKQKENYTRLIKADNPLVLAIDAQILRLKTDILDNIESIKKNLNLTEVQLAERSVQLEDIIKSIPGKERSLIDISREQAIKNNLFNFLLQTKEETEISLASAISDSRTVDPAHSSIGPVEPVHSITYLIFTVIGLSIPFVIIVATDLFNDKIKSRKDIEKNTKTPILGEISWTEHEKAFVKDNNRSVFAEQIRALRTNLSFLSSDKVVQSILFTSTKSEEGKTFISMNLGASLAMAGKKTLFLEFDMRKPKLTLGLNLEETKGLSSYLIGHSELNDIIRPVPGQDNLFIISCGAKPPNPVELLLNGRIDGLFEELRKRFDNIIIDAPPIGIVTDAQILEKQADATLFVLRQNFTPKENIELVDSLYKNAKFKKLNIVFNGIKKGGSYGYTYGYYAESEEESGLLNNILIGLKKKME